tara:strand:- start:26 stop:1306 length:1281 start_codon:yes stop_codon:yes gene_type:complete
MKRKILLRGPVLTQSGYGEQSRYAMRALRSREDLFDIYIQPIVWGATSWSREYDEERQWIDNIIKKTVGYFQSNPNPSGPIFDYSLQATIPNEFEKLARINIGYTAGIETTKVHHDWIIKTNQNTDKVITTSNHSRDILSQTEYEAVNEANGQTVKLRTNVPINTVNYCVKEYKNLPELQLNLDYNKNLLCVAQWGPRKNLEKTILWFMQEFRDEEVGLVIKANMAKNCLIDRVNLQDNIKQLIANNDLLDTTCKVYLLHGDLTDAEMHSLYKNEKILGLVSLTCGEGFGLPIFEAAYSGLPVAATGWSGHLDFLQDEKGNDLFYNIAYDLTKVPEQVVWEGVIVNDCMWAQAREQPAKQAMRKLIDSPELSINAEKSIRKRFSPEIMYDKFVNEIIEFDNRLGIIDEDVQDDWLSDIDSIIQEYE